MNFHKIQPRESLNKAFLKVKPNRNDIENFKKNLQNLIDKINESESEEFHKNLIGDFLKNTYYSNNHFINTKGRNDLVIHNGKDAKTTVGVILEFKKPTNKSEMLKVDNLNTKAFQELVLYFLRERLTAKNLEIKYLIATNIYEWFIFDANIFEKAFIENKTLVQQFTDFEAGRLSNKKTDFFYKEIAKPTIDEIADKITFTHLDIRDYQQYLNPGEHPDEHKLISLFKLFSPEHLLKLPFTNDSNTLDKGFYSELLHIIGLVETKEGSKKLIQRKKEPERNVGSLIENAIIQLDSLDKISRLEKPEQFGETYQEQLFNLGLELAITWINRILFLKLLEAQLIRYHKNDPSWGFLNLQKVKNYDDLNSLFFSVLARKPQERSQKLQTIFAHVPYLNSSLFELTDLEQDTIVISNLGNEKLPIFTGTILKDNNGKKRTGEINALEYLFEFLNAYDFSSETGEEIQEENKRLINAAVLGLIFEKINGYKDGSFFTPGFITMYMCRETIRKAVVQKFNEVKGWNCETIDDLYDKIEDKKAANDIINSLKICDPAVGSGHFLVSALNEIIAIKSELKILLDREGKRLKEYQIEVVNDELIITDEDGLLFEYNPKNQESQRVQETLFHEKQIIIETCLFGVDINPNSVKICRLRLWIELLKNAYYKIASNYTELETLPNIDINIKCGNSLISRFALDADLRVALNKSNYSIEIYRNAVQTYRNAENREQKREMTRLINDIKGNLKTTLGLSDPNKTKLRRLQGEVENLENQTSLFEETKAEKKAREKKIAKLNNEIDKLRVEIEDIESGKIYENAFEWRFEFPEVLNNDGVFVGFDVVIGNPPYIGGREWGLEKPEFNYYLNTYQGAEYQFDAYVLFWELATILSKYFICYITPNTWLNNQKNKLIRNIILNLTILKIADFSKTKVFEDATVLPIITLIHKALQPTHQTEILMPSLENNSQLMSKYIVNQSLWQQDELKIINIDLTEKDISLRNKIEDGSQLLEELAIIKFGIKIYETGKGNPKQKKEDAQNRIFEANFQVDDTYRPYLEGKDINKYFVSWQNRWIKYGQNLAAPRDISLFEGQRILVRRIVGRTLIACYTNDNFVTSQLLQIVKPYDESLTKYILGIINSQLMAFYFKKKYNRQDITFPEIRIYELCSLPIKISHNKSDLEKIVDQILIAKKADPNANTTALETEIDQMVYQLYNLTAEEIKIIESSR
ncbi:Eco57I restriction-modification methylase domain-containing protein [Anabaena aphanizomenioides LEGE 00250]|uniref:site-specific DNA-methyltransferase (adenine-specific) n=2 Tax=Sphaerospermopsis aphanizomenoides TaxID=459663 RepID=A0ABR9V9P8_9CYAN|nr:Eco57I restriction-modification methylase domain-containing protein [Sphaerospermopsis aphanizomenoides LEGE 00250]